MRVTNLEPNVEILLPTRNQVNTLKIQKCGDCTRRDPTPGNIFPSHGCHTRSKADGQISDLRRFTAHGLHTADDFLRAVALVLMDWAWAQSASKATRGDRWALPAQALQRRVLPELAMRLAFIESARQAATSVSSPSVDKVDTSYLGTLLGYNARRAAVSEIEVLLQDMAPYDLHPVECSAHQLAARHIWVRTPLGSCQSAALRSAHFGACAFRTGSKTWCCCPRRRS